MTYAEKLNDVSLFNKSGIYKLIINNSIYIGSAVNLTKRLRQHLNDLKANRHRNIHLQRAFNKYQIIDFEIIEIIDDVHLLIISEQKYIDTLKPRYNISPNAGSQLGFIHSESSRKRISEVQKGKKLSDETRKRMSESGKGKKLSEAHKQKLSMSKKGELNPFYRAGKSHPQYGISKSMVTRNRISETSKMRGSHKGVNNAASKSGVFYDVNTGANYIFQSLKPLCVKLGVKYAGIHSAMKKGKFYKDRFFVNFQFIPENISTDIENINPIFH